MTRSWSKYQKAIFDDAEFGKGNSIVRARAGTGKTTSLLEAMSRLKGSIAGLAFNKAIATELSVRLDEEFPQVRGSMSTCHSLGFAAVRSALYVRVEKDRTMLMLKELMGNDYSTFDYRKALSDAVTRAKCELVETPAEIDPMLDRAGIEVPSRQGEHSLDARPTFIAQVAELMQLSKKVEVAIDFADMIWLPNVLDLKVKKVQNVLGDECQDWNRSQLELSFRALENGGRFFAFGDDRQAIYRFMGADENSMNRIREKYDAKVLPLSITYRCPKSVVCLAQQIVPDLEAASDAEPGIVDSCSADVMFKYAGPGDFILSRTNAPLVSLCLQFLRDGRRATIRGRNIGDQLVNFVKNSRCTDVPALRKYTTVWAEDEIKRLDSLKRDTQVVEDRRDCIFALSDGEPSVHGVVEKLKTLFADDDDRNRIVLSSTHKAKGLESDRVWLLKGTYRNRDTVEEDNLWYVAVTRSKSELYLVEGYEKKVPYG